MTDGGMVAGTPVDNELAIETPCHRRAAMRLAAGGLLLAAGGLYLPDRLETAEAREGAYGGKLGGRHGKDRRGRDQRKRRDHGNDKNKDHGKKGGAPRGNNLPYWLAIDFGNETGAAFTFELYRFAGINEFKVRGPESLPPHGTIAARMETKRAELRIRLPGDSGLFVYDADYDNSGAPPRAVTSSLVYLTANGHIGRDYPTALLAEGESNGWKFYDTGDSPELKVLRTLDGNVYANLSVQLR